MATPVSLEDLVAEVEAWFAAEVQKPPVSYVTEIYNQMHAAKISLKDRLAVLLTGEPLAPPSPPAVEPVAAEPEEQTAEAPANASTSSKSTKAGS